jgi:hypothetical protein
MEKPMIKTPKGLAEIDKIYISELGYLMLKVCLENGTFVTYNLGKHNSDVNMFTDKIM